MKFLKVQKLRFLLFFLGFLVFTSCEKTSPIVVDIWYGEKQSFGLQGNTQPFVNILGNISSEYPLKQCYYALNTDENIPFFVGTDLHRLAKNGDFNLEFLHEKLQEGDNLVAIYVEDSLGNSARANVLVNFIRGRQWPLPYGISWDTVTNIQHVVQVLDGKWEITADGVRTSEPFYDRTLSLGDASWINYEVTAELVFHGYTEPEKGPPTYNVVHAAIASRYPGFDTDEFSPHRKWYPLGATCEFRLMNGLDSCSFRILGGNMIKNDRAEIFHRIKLETPYVMKARVFDLGAQNTKYQAKIWQAGNTEPEGWDIELIKSPDDIFSGCALLIAHHTDVTWGKIEVAPL